MEINKKIIEYLANLSKIKLTKLEGEKLTFDIKAIINYFNELSQLDTSGIEEMTGGTNLKNIFRKDAGENPFKNLGKKSFPKNKKGFLEVPKVL